MVIPTLETLENMIGFVEAHPGEYALGFQEDRVNLYPRDEYDQGIYNPAATVFDDRAGALALDRLGEILDPVFISCDGGEGVE